MESKETRGFSRLSPEATGRFQRPEVPKATRRHRSIEYVLFATLAVLLVVGGFALYSSFSPKFKKVPNQIEAGIRQDRINILFIGVGGELHRGKGEELADSLILASLKPSSRQVAIISIPRDFYVKIGSYGMRRLNLAHSIGVQGGYPGGGAGLTADTISSIFNQPIHAFVRMDFQALLKIIDDLGGVDIYVQRSFYDYLFRDGFRSGMQRMDGKRALAYARYRYVIGYEGDNYARELRQQQVIAAIREKLKKRDPKDIVGLMGALRTLSKHTDTNLTNAQLVWLYRTFREVSPQQVRHVSLKPFMEKFQLNSLTEPGEAVRTKTGDYRQLQQVSGTIFSDMREIRTEDQIMVESTSSMDPSQVYATPGSYPAPTAQKP